MPSTLATTLCPKCAAPLLQRLPLDQWARCSNCSHCFILGSRSGKRLSRKAVASLVLGILSIVFGVLTGLPALILGGLALRDIYRSGATLRGGGLAMGGMVSSALGFGTSCCFAMSLLVFLTTETAHDPEGVRKIAQTIGEFDHPSTLQPRHGFSVGVVRNADVHYSDDANAPTVLLNLRASGQIDTQSNDGQFPVFRGMLGSRSDVRPASQTERSIVAAGEPVTLKTNTVVAVEDGTYFRQYSAVLPGSRPSQMRLVQKSLPPASTDSPDAEPRFPMSDEEVQRIYESFRPAQ